VNVMMTKMMTMTTIPTKANTPPCKGLFCKKDNGVVVGDADAVLLA
jgi:hypothetical protein